MLAVRAKVRGLMAEIENSPDIDYIKFLMKTVKVTTVVKTYGNKKYYKKLKTLVNLYKENEENGSVLTSLGVLKYLEKIACLKVECEFLDGVECYSWSTDDYEIPEGIKNSSKFEVDGKRRDYFYEAISACLGNVCGLVRLPTGSGKTEIELTLAYNLKKVFGRGIILVPTRLLVSQFLEKARSYGISASSYSDYRNLLKSDSAENLPEDSNILISTPMVIFNDICSNFCPRGIKWVITDESHHMKADTWLGVLLNLPELRRVYGFSATPLRSIFKNVNFLALGYENSLCVLASGPLIYSKDPKSLEGFVSLPKLIEIEYRWKNKDIVNLLERDGTVTNNYSRILEVCSFNEDRINFIKSILEVLCKFNRNSILFTDRKALGYNLLSKCLHIPVSVWYSDDIRTSENEVKDETWIRSNFGTDSCRAIIASSHATEGLDIKNQIDCVILIDGEGDVKTIQRVGRATRLSSKDPVVINLVDIGVGVLKKHSEKRSDLVCSAFNLTQMDIISVNDPVELENLL